MSASIALRLAAPCAPMPFELRRGLKVISIGEFELRQIGDYDINALIERARSHAGQWVAFPKYQPPKTYKPYR